MPEFLSRPIHDQRNSIRLRRHGDNAEGPEWRTFGWQWHELFHIEGYASNVPFPRTWAPRPSLSACRGNARPSDGLGGANGRALQIKTRESGVTV